MFFSTNRWFPLASLPPVTFSPVVDLGLNQVPHQGESCEDGIEDQESPKQHDGAGHGARVSGGKGGPYSECVKQLYQDPPVGVSIYNISCKDSLATSKAGHGRSMVGCRGEANTKNKASRFNLLWVVVLSCFVRPDQALMIGIDHPRLKLQHKQ